MRPDWDTIWTDFAKNIARRSYDPQFQVGCCIVSSDNCQVLSIGYNGNHTGGPNERDSAEPGHSGFIHAEINALIKLDYNNPKSKTMYLTLSPCKQCAKAIINGGIHKVVYLYKYRDTSGLELLQNNGVKVSRFVPNASQEIN
jgi:dCMP deaminase|tara:strand:+ start:116 stop:544 length:429 start_codon:yes stop_codon:yes gene_type:complete